MKTKLTDDYDINILKGMSQWRLYQQMQKKPASENNFAGGIALSPLSYQSSTQMNKCNGFGYVARDHFTLFYNTLTFFCRQFD